MALFSRSGAPAEAVYARVLDGEHLWLAVRGDGPLTLRAEGRPDLEVVTDEPGEPFGEEGLLTAIVPLGAVTAGLDAATPLRLFSGAGRKAAPVRHSAPTTTSDVSVDPGELVVASVDGEVVVRRRPSPSVAVRIVGSTEEGVLLALGAPADQVSVTVKDRVLLDLPVTDGRFVLGEVAALEPGTTATLRVGGCPVVRPHNVLARPHFAVTLPPLPDPDLELRWLRNGRIAVHRRGAS